MERWNPRRIFLFQRSRALLASVLVVGLASAPVAAQTSAQTTALTGATVIDGTGGPQIPNAVVLVKGDRLTCVGSESECPIPEDAKRVDVSDRFITPGLVDAHVHFSQTGWIDGRVRRGWTSLDDRATRSGRQRPRRGARACRRTADHPRDPDRPDGER